MTLVNLAARLKILIVLQSKEQADVMQWELEGLGHRVQFCGELNDALGWLRKWQPDLIVTEEGLGREQPDAGLRLAEYCRLTEDQVNGWPGTRTLMFIPIADWGRFSRAKRTGAHVILKSASFDAATRYVQTIADNLVTDRVLGPVLIGIHRFKGAMPLADCENCEWVGALMSYDSSQTDARDLTPVRIALLNILLFRRRGQSPRTIADFARESTFLKRILQGHVLRESAIKMEVCRLRRDLGGSLDGIGAPYSGEYFLPPVPHGVKMYHLAGNRRLVHVPVADQSMIASELQGRHCKLTGVSPLVSAAPL